MLIIETRFVVSGTSTVWGGIFLPKQGIKIENLKDILRSTHENVRWSLCIGAGTSQPIFPDWFSLVDTMIDSVSETDPKIKISLDKIKKMGFSPDSIIQALKNLVNLNEEEFLDLMSCSLYGNLMDIVGPAKWKSISAVLETSNPSYYKDSLWKDFIETRNTTFQNSTANLLANVLIKAREKGVAPDAILSFNAESLLLALMNSYIREPFIGKTKAAGDVPKICDKIVDSTSTSYSNHIAYVHCHGILPIPGAKKTRLTPSDKLVFTENSYLQLSNNAFSWQSSNFINTCMNQRVVFVGVSLTDPNMRKWLSWIHQNRLNEYSELGIEPKNSTQHYWIKTLPESEEEMLWFESAVAHLGVRIIWINSWDEVGTALSKMLGLER